MIESRRESADMPGSAVQTYLEGFSARVHVASRFLQVKAHAKCIRLYASADQSATLVVFAMPRTANGANPRYVLTSAFTVSLVLAR
jgi:hypothetical protein